MARVVDCYFSPISVWAFLGMARYRRVLEVTGARGTWKPVDIGRLFAAVGALPLAQRSPARRANRLQEIKRWSEFLAIPLNPNPRHFPTDPGPACRLIAAAHLQGDDGGRLAEACLRACWVEERDIADPATLVALADGCGLAGDKLIQQADTEQAQALVEAYTDEAIERGALGSPCFVIGDAVFFGQDRLDFVERALMG